MLDVLSLSVLCGAAIVLAPVLLVVIFGLTSLVGRPLTEEQSRRAVTLTTLIGFFCSFGVFLHMIITGDRHLVINFGDWVHVGHAPFQHFHYSLKFEFDRLSVPFVSLVFVLCGTISTFATRYLHREPGYNRFFVLYSFFLAGMVIASLADTVETLFAGWEFVGLSSALLVAFFQERPAPSRNGFRVWIVYRVSDAALLLAAVVLHHMSGEGDFDSIFGEQPWPNGVATVTRGEGLIVGFLLLIAAAGKSALIPFSGWLPRAMEGPTPSSAVFYGALSVHLGAYLLLRMSPLLATSRILSMSVVALGLTTAVCAALIGRVQTDIKSVLSFASLTQVGLIVAEIGLGWHYIPLVHLLGHACLRTLQFLRAPTFLQDRRILENALGRHVPLPVDRISHVTSSRSRSWFYRFALERGYQDAILDRYVAAPFLRCFRKLDLWEQRMTQRLARTPTQTQKRDMLQEVERAK